MTQPAAPVVATPLQQLVRIYHIIAPLFEQEIGMSMARWRMLIHLRNSGPISQADLQARLQIDPAAVTRQAKQLDDEGLVERWPSPEDNRRTMVRLTQRGQALIEERYPHRQQFEMDVLDGLDSADLELLERCLGRIRDNAQRLADEAKN